MQKTLTPAERLIVAADFKPPTEGWPGESNPDSIRYGWRRKWVKERVLALADSLKGTGVYLKVNSALRACGYDLIDEIHARGLKVFADLKLFDIGETLSTDGILLKEARPELLTTVCTAGIVAMQALKAELPDTEVLGVTVLTSVKVGECMKMFPLFEQANVLDVVTMLAHKADESGMDGIICAPAEAAWIRTKIRSEMTINTPAIRPSWFKDPKDDQNPDRIMTPAKAIKAGADRIVVGRPIVKAEKPYDAVMRTIEEIASAMM